MQVSHTNDHVTHAVIGGGQTIDFGISNSAEFFNILSSTLYKDQILAVVREVLCNAWDAHIEAKCTDKPVEITLEDNKLIVKDFGQGIHHDDIGIIYGTYGNSTKKNDGQQTGGFGLGCKSPFAYTDHFEVTSCHAGVKTIYTMAKSSAQVGGKPGITTIAQFPTNETGLSVSINLQPNDVSKFRMLIKRIARNGDMNVAFNGAQLPTLDFDTSKANWVIYGSQMHVLGETNTPPVCIRYGNVVYPVDGSDTQINALHERITAVIHQLRASYYQQVTILFQAPPHSIAVTPSRESLSMQAHTVATLKGLFEGFLNQYKIEVEQEEKFFLANHVQTIIQGTNQYSLFSSEQSLAGVSSNATTAFTVQTVKEMVHQKLSINYPKSPDFRKQDLITRVSALKQAKLVDQGKAISFLKELQNSSNVYELNPWVVKNIYGKLVAKLLQANLPINSLLVSRTPTNPYHTRYSEDLLHVSSKSLLNLNDTLPFLRKIVVLATSRTNIRERFAEISDSPLKLDKRLGFLVYIAGRKKDDLEKAQKFFASSEFTVYDMTQLEEKEEVVKPKTPPKKREKGSPLLYTMMDPTTKKIDSTRVLAEGLDRTDKAEFVVLGYPRGSYNNSLPVFSNQATKEIIELFGKRGVVVTTKNQRDKWTAAGTPELTVWLAEQVINYVKASKPIQDKLRNSPDNVLEFASRQDIRSVSIRVLFSLPQLKKFEVVLTGEEQSYLYLFSVLSSLSHYFQDKPFAADYTQINSLEPSKEITDLVMQMKSSNLLDIFDTHCLRRALENPDTQSSAMKIFMFALKN